MASSVLISAIELGGTTMPNDVKTSGRQKAAIHAHEREAPFGAFFEGNQQASSRCIDTMMELSQEIARFAQVRYGEGVAAWSGLLACRKLEDTIEWQRRFAEKAGERYSEEITKLWQMMLGMAGLGLPSRAQRQHTGT
jgi:hypothetical protein